MLCSLCGYSPPALQTFSSPGSPGAPRTSGHLSRAWQGLQLAAPRQAREFANGNCTFPKGKSWFSLKSCLLPSVSLIPVIIHSENQVPNLKATPDSFPSLTSKSYHGSFRTVSGRDSLDLVPSTHTLTLLQSIFFNSTKNDPLQVCTACEKGPAWTALLCPSNEPLPPSF